MKKLSILFVSFLLLASCIDRKTKDDFDYGKVVNGTYINKYFKISINLPKDWKVQSKETQEQLTKRGEQAAFGDNESLKAQIKASEVNTAQLLMVSKYEVGSPVESNPSFIAIAENIKGLPGIKDGKDYLFHVKKLLGQTQLNYIIKDGFEKQTIAGHEFYILSAQINANGKVMTQNYFSTLIDGFCFSFVTTYTSEDENKELMDVIKAIKNI